MATCSFSLIIFLISTLVDLSSTQQTWALLVAGSSGYYNYRHQADICHSYHVLRSHGFPKDRIIVMMYDDIAHNEENPVKGNIINHPDGPNVYKGVTIDYKGEEVRPDIFLKVLSGNAKAVHKSLGRKGRVIKSGPSDRIFVYFADHGAPGLLGFPNDVLHADDLHATLRGMYANKQYYQMVLYIEACESGSVFEHMDTDINVFVTTAANADESSYACYFDDKRQTYLGDVYSIKWLEDSDKENLNTETLSNQFKLVKQETNTSHVMEYGDITLGKLPVGDFQGNTSSKSLLFTPTLEYDPTVDAVPSEEVALEILKRRIASSSREEAKKHWTILEALYERKSMSESFFRDLVTLTSGSGGYEALLRTPLQKMTSGCYKESVRLIMEMCPGMGLQQNDFALRKLRVVWNMCGLVEVKPATIWAAIGKVAYEHSICAISQD